ncbi:MAG: VWA domain-containing protein [Aureispira sp.]|nr:VWA domain-containing protein [Aureispira sp.]
MTKVLNLTIALDNQYYLRGSNKNEVYLYIELKAAEAKKDTERIPLNISLVLDRSGSMHGDKLNYVKKAAEFVINNLNKNDQISIVQYDDKVDLVSKSQALTNKQELLRKVANIQSAGMTNLSGGMMEGYSQVKSTKKEGYVNRVLLLSDGLANVGITDHDKLKEIARNQFRNNGVGLSTFGVGEGFNEILMTHLAEHGGANYYFIEKPDQIPQIFAEELEGLLSVVAQNAKLKVSFPSAHLTCEKVYGYVSHTQGDTITVDFNDVFSQEEKAVLIKFKTRNRLDLDLDFNINVEYDDVMETLDKVTEQVTAQLKMTEDKVLYESGVNRIALENTCLFVANDLFEDAIKVVDQRKFEEAKKLLEKTKVYLEAHLKIFPASEQLQTQLQKVVEYLERLPSMRQMDSRSYSMAQKSTRMDNYKLKRKK